MLVGIAVLPFAMLLDAVFYRLFKNTPGKWLAGVRVLDSDGNPLPPPRYLRRNFILYYAGLGFGIPIVSLFTLVHSFRKANQGELLPWERRGTSRSLRVRAGRWRPYVTAASYITLLAGIFALGQAATHPTAILAASAWMANSTAPKMIDSVIRLDRVESRPDLTLQFDLSILNVSASHLNRAAEKAWFQGTVRRRLFRNVCTSPDMQFFRDMGVTVRYHYADKHGAPLAIVDIPTRECPHRQDLGGH